jgi:type II protein arginine methyltransferase
LDLAVEARRPHPCLFLENSNQSDASISGKAVEWAVAARAMLASGLTDQAIKLALKVRNAAPDDVEATMLASEVLSADIPRWHFRLVRDHVRNAAFDAALRRAVKPGMRVLDIGSGTGLLAMMAARAGAEQVFSCEANPAVSDAAREIVAANGFSDRIRVLAKHSTRLDADADLGGRVDLIVSEVVSNDMLTESVLPTMEHAVASLLKPEGSVIPAKGTVRIALAFDPDWSETRMGITDGFDLTTFNRLAKPRYSIPTTKTQLQLMSDASDLFEFDFGSSRQTPDARTQRTFIARGGPVNCVAQWIHLQLDDQAAYENRPGDHTYSNWDIFAYPMPHEVDLQAGDAVTVNASHDRARVRIWTPLEPKGNNPPAR